MLIRSQDKRQLIELNNIRISVNKYMTYGENKHDSYYNVECPNGVLGKYTTEEKALEVLDKIEEEYFAANCTYKVANVVFHMPKDTEVD